MYDSLPDTRVGWLFKKGSASSVRALASCKYGWAAARSNSHPLARTSIPLPQTWRKRWFVLRGPVLRWYEPSWFFSNPTSGTLKGEVRLFAERPRRPRPPPLPAPAHSPTNCARPSPPRPPPSPAEHV